MDYQPGQILPGTKYQVVRELGAGGMGVVYQVVKPPQIQGVLKLMSAELAQHIEFRRRFLDEVHVLAQLDHPNIVKVSDYDQLSDGTPFYVMELLHGRTVRDVLATVGRVPPRVAFEITRQLCEALHCAHTHTPQVVHRDIKPENIFLHAPKHGEPQVKLIDFGVVAIGDRAHDGAFVGTWKYAAPEQIRGERATPATDLYAVGLVLYEMLAGAGPFDHMNTGQLVSQAHLQTPPPSLAARAPWVPKSILELVESALAKDPAKRPRDAYAFAERLFELEWASDGKNPHDYTAEGPIAHVLSRVEPAPRAPAQVPQIAVRPDVRHRGPTRPGVGDDAPPPNEDELLAALVARPDARIPSSPRISKPVVLRGSPSSTPRSVTAVTEEAPESTDTFASHASAPGVPSRRKGWIAIPIAIAALGFVLIAGAVVVKLRQPAPAAAPPSPAAVPAPAPSPSPSPSIAAPEPVAVVPSASASSAPPPKPVSRPAPRPSAPPSPSPAKKDDGFMRAL